MSTPESPSIEVVEVIDSAPYLGWPLAITILTIVIMLVDGYDLQTMSFIAPAILADWGIARSDLSWVLNGSLIGMAYGFVVGFAGGYFVAWLYNRIVELREAKPS